MRRTLFALSTACLITAAPAAQRVPPGGAGIISSGALRADIVGFLRQEIAAHTMDITSLNPPQPRVVGAKTGGDFS